LKHFALLAPLVIPVVGAAVAHAGDLSAALLADASQRPSLAGSSGHDGKNFFIADEEGVNRLTIDGYLQARYYANTRDEAPGGDEDFTGGFQMRRTRIGAAGTVFSKDLSFRILGDFSRSDGVFRLQDAYGDYKLSETLTARWGQFKTQFLHEDNVSDALQLMVDRSAVAAVFGQDRTQGIELMHRTEQFRASGSYNDGMRALNTDFDNGGAVPGGEADFAFSGKLEWKWAGDWKRFSDFTSFRGSDYAGLLGGAAHYQSGGETGGPTADTELLSYTIDASIEGDGWNAFGAVVGRNIDTAGATFDDYGLLAQAGFFVSEQTELFARYDIVMPDEDRAATADPFSSITLGANYYLSPKSHAAKFSADVVWYPDSQADTGGLVPANTGIGLLADTPGSEGQVVFRVQMQIIF
jgi:hypothetical protein